MRSEEKFFFFFAFFFFLRVCLLCLRRFPLGRRRWPHLSGPSSRGKQAHMRCGDAKFLIAFPFPLTVSAAAWVWGKRESPGRKRGEKKSESKKKSGTHCG
ncbi:hypothetical protein TRSC58_07372 [Trypanosoma rangeli SC58]|uniref:Uncharacterized protein n=1 Tax=Trypanosoma rangeli SC58 TaxID=429131 RepID=A0A061ISY0_TRYRA|nr:hypothetical protein TRSC58_07372 [Trypanosoma rangeli SC58]